MSLNTVLQCQKVTVDFDGFKAIDALDFEVKDKELHVLIGPNGAGKSTLLDVICGKVKPVGGQVIFKGQYHLNRLAEFEIARLGVGRKFQTPSIYPSLRVIEHLEIAMKQPKSLWHVLRTKLSRDEQMELEHMISFIGLEEWAYAQAGTLSHGQKQWLEIGMVLVQKPELLLLDEPIAGMTEEEEEKTTELLQTIAEKCAVLVVEHDMTFVRKVAHRVTVMHEGRILSAGKMEEVQSDPRVIEVYLGQSGEACVETTTA